jgi:hypothetical protein
LTTESVPPVKTQMPPPESNDRFPVTLDESSVTNAPVWTRMEPPQPLTAVVVAGVNDRSRRFTAPAPAATLK